MGAFTTRALTKEEFQKIIKTIENGFRYAGINHRPNKQIAEVLILQANLGMRIADILHMSLSDIVKDGEHYRLDITEQKTLKKRIYIVPDELYTHIEYYCLLNKINPHRRLFEFTERAVQKILKSACQFLGLENISTHSFRKFAACQIYENSGRDIEATREFLQHESVTTTQRYIKRSRCQLERAICASVNLV